MTYWENRVKQEMKAKQKAEYSLDVKMQDMYDYYSREIEKEINDFYARYAAREKVSISEAKKRASEMDVQAFNEKAKRYVQTKDKSKIANEELAVYNLKMRVSRLQMLQYNIDLQLLGLSKEETKLAGEYLNQEYKKEIESQAGILGEMLNNPVQTKISLETILDKPFHGVTWKTGLRHQQDQIRNVVARATQDLVVKGKNPTVYMSKLTKDLKIKRYEAKRLLVTEGARIQSEVRKSSYLDNEFEEFKLIPEPNACDICKSKAKEEGVYKVYKVSDMQPGVNTSPFHPHCKCSDRPYFNSDKVIEKLKEKHRNDKDLVKPKEDKVLTNSDDSGTIKEKDLNKVTEITKLKNVMDEVDYKEFLSLVNDVDNKNVKKLYANYINGIGSFEKVQRGGSYDRGIERITYSYTSSKDLNKFSTLTHEIGHYFDNDNFFNDLSYKEVELLNSKVGFNAFKNRPSQSDGFLNAIRKDKETLKKIFISSKEDILSSNASNGVQDALDGMFGLYDGKFVKWGHGDKYYDRHYSDLVNLFNVKKSTLKESYVELGLDASNQMKIKNLTRTYETASEAWANISSSVLSGGDELEYVKKYLPYAYDEYLKILNKIKE